MGDVTNATPTFQRAIQDAIEARLADINVSMPGIIEDYDATTGFATVSPCIKRIYFDDDEAVDLPALNNVPVCYPRSSGGIAYLHLPVKPGDTCHLIFSQRSLDTWKIAGGKVDPDDIRKHHLSDAVAVLGGYPAAIPLPPTVDADALTIGHGLAGVELQADGTLTMKNEVGSLMITPEGAIKGMNAVGSFELSATGQFKYANATGEFTDLIIQALNEVVAGLTSTSLGPQPLIMAGMAAIILKLQSFKE